MIIAITILTLSLAVVETYKESSSLIANVNIKTSQLDSVIQIEVLLVATLAGFFGALMGLGGGVIIVPVLTSIFNLKIHEAIAISIIGVVATSISGGSSYIAQRITNIRLAIFLETSTTLGAFLGALLTLIMPGKFLYIIFSVFAFYVSLAQLHSIKEEVKKISVRGFSNVLPDAVSKYLNLSGEYFDEREKIKVEYVGMLGIGGGFLKVSAMNLFMNIPLKVAIATSKFMICITAATSAVIYYVSGVVRLDLVAPLAVGTTIGATLGSRVMNKFKIKWLKLIFAFIMFYLGYAMLRKGLLLIFGLSLP